MGIPDSLLLSNLLLNCTSVILHHNQTLVVPEDLPMDKPVMMAVNPSDMMRDPLADGRPTPDCCPLVILSVVSHIRQHILTTCMSRHRQRGARFLLIVKDRIKKGNMEGVTPFFDCYLVPANNLGKVLCRYTVF